METKQSTYKGQIGSLPGVVLAIIIFAMIAVVGVIMLEKSYDIGGDMVTNSTNLDATYTSVMEGLNTLTGIIPLIILAIALGIIIMAVRSLAV